ncbi:MAG: type IV pilus secretin PilQ [Rickettsiales bacterium]
MIRKNASALLLALALFGCIPPDHVERMREESPLPPGAGLVRPKDVIKNARPRNRETASYGPKVAAQAENMRKKYDVQLNREDPFDYTKLGGNAQAQKFFVDLNVENMDVRAFIDMMGAMSGINFLVSDEVSGTVTAKLQHVPWDDALDSVLNVKGLAKHVDRESGIVRIHKREAIAQLESFERQRRADLHQAMLLELASEPLFTEVFKLFYIKPEEAKTIIQGVLNEGEKDSGAQAGMRDTSAQVTVDARRNLLLVKARKNDLDLIKKLIAQIDAKTSQVFIEAFIVEVTDDFAKELGARLEIDKVDATATLESVEGNADVNVGAGSLVSNAANTAKLFLGLNGEDNLKLQLSAMEEEGLTRVIANPRIFTLDNKEAVIFQGDEVPYETVSQEGTKIEFKEAGLKLLVTPNVIGDGNLQLDIKVNKDTVNTAEDNPPITKSEIQTSLVSRDGEIVVIGGIYTESASGTASKIPGLGDAPGLGHAFRKDTKGKTRKELMIFIAPKVI